MPVGSSSFEFSKWKLRGNTFFPYPPKVFVSMRSLRYGRPERRWDERQNERILMALRPDFWSLRPPEGSKSLQLFNSVNSQNSANRPPFLLKLVGVGFLSLANKSPQNFSVASLCAISHFSLLGCNDYFQFPHFHHKVMIPCLWPYLSLEIP